MGNNPIAFCDPTGTEVAVVMFTIAIIVIVPMVYYYSTRFLSNWIANGRNITAALKRALNSVISVPKDFAHLVYGKLQELDDAIGRSFEKAKAKAIPRYKSLRERHHIVAHSSPRAEPARKILSKLGIRVKTDKDNLVELKTGFHRRLHRKLYFEWVNNTIQFAYSNGKTKAEKEKKVRRALTHLKNTLIAMNAVAPF